MTTSTTSIHGPATGILGGKSRRAGSRRLMALAGVAVVTAGIVYLAWRPDAGGSNPTSQAPSSSDRAMVRLTSFDITTRCSGELEARHQIEIRSRLESSSTIVELTPEGRSVRAGELLVRLNSDRIEQEILEQTLQVESARAELVAAENGYNIQVNENESRLRQSTSKVTLAKLALEQWEKGDVEKRRLELKLAMDKATRDHDRLKDKVFRSRLLHGQGFLSKNELELDEISFIEALAAVDKSGKDNEIYENYRLPEERERFTSALIEAEAELERVKMNNEIELASKEAARTNRRKQLAVREEKLRNLQNQFASSTIRAPSDGLVVYATSMSSGRGFGGDREGPLQIGRQVFPNELLMILPDTSDMMASVRVQESLAGRVRPGQVVTVQVDAAGGKTYSGRVESTSVLAETGGWRDPNLREYTVKVALDQSELEGEGLKPSMRVDAIITLGRVEDAASIPVQAVFNEGAVRFVYRQDGMKFVRTPVRMGRRSDTFAEITAGLAPGAVVLVREPTAGEVMTRPWDKAALELAGYSLDADGKPVASGGGGDRQPRSGGGGPPGTGSPNSAGRGEGRGRISPGPRGNSPESPAPREDASKPGEKGDSGSVVAEGVETKAGGELETPSATQAQPREAAETGKASR
ncbi:MAG: HlyD family efflux transporter periplasmic adaptor subunit [Phycisphaeraceae bacterium]|nr:HlyD family efflux transporter periplasmic adaptor subunit [Phycisphaerae bacterium]MBX3391995.1 HlyD family efflux transporter periplasmic adaptor subunit [Phycisphaeraceae bacterium]HRJ48942.1 HlyD family efflux transporter periplasmic adaptor subunit [Phycisphaerales bacterium]